MVSWGAGPAHLQPEAVRGAQGRRLVSRKTDRQGCGPCLRAGAAFTSRGASPGTTCPKFRVLAVRSHTPVPRTRVVHSLCESPGFSNIWTTAWGPGYRRSEPVSTAHHTVSQRDPLPLRSRSRLNFNEQLCFFASGNDGCCSPCVGWMVGDAGPSSRRPSLGSRRRDDLDVRLVNIRRAFTSKLGGPEFRTPDQSGNSGAHSGPPRGVAPPRTSRRDN